MMLRTYNIDSFHATGLFLYHLETSKNQMCPDVFLDIKGNHWHERG